MKNSLDGRNIFSTLYLFVFTCLTVCCTERAEAATSPYVTQQTDVPLNQSTNDTVNGVLPYFNSHDPIEGSIASLVDATSTDTPTANVIPGPDNTWIGIAWDFGDPGPGYMWKLDRFDAWIAAFDEARKSYQADLSVSNSGDVNDFTVIPNSKQWDALVQNSQYNHIRYDFPNEFIAGAESSMDKHPVKGFRYLRLNSRGDTFNGADRQPRFVEVDIWVSKVGVPPTIISAPRNSAGDVDIVWSTVPGATYALEYKANLNNSTWTNLSTVVADAETESVIDPSTSGSQRFYRVVLQP